MKIRFELEESGGMWSVLMHSEPGKEGSTLLGVHMSRDGRRCYTAIGSLQDHNGHRPWFPTRAKAEAYAERVLGQVRAALKAAEGIREIDKEMKGVV